MTLPLFQNMWLPSISIPPPKEMDKDDFNEAFDNINNGNLLGFKNKVTSVRTLTLTQGYVTLYNGIPLNSVVCKRDGNPWTFLHHACTSKQYPIASFILDDESVDPNATSKGFITPLHILCFTETRNFSPEKKKEYFELLKKLIHHPSTRLDTTSEKGHTALIYAVMGLNTVAVKELLSSKKNLAFFQKADSGLPDLLTGDTLLTAWEISEKLADSSSLMEPIRYMLEKYAAKTGFVDDKLISISRQTQAEPTQPSLTMRMDPGDGDVVSNNENRGFSFTFLSNIGSNLLPSICR